MSGSSWVTLATNDSYSLGALVLAHSLKRVGTAHQLVVMVTPGVTQSMREKLLNIYDLVFEVNILDSKDERNLLLLQRPELGITFTKLHCWRLTQYNKCVFLDADTLVLQNCDELFDREEFSAAPDVGWPDCFNSGVFVYKPSDETFNSLLAFALEKGSFDGGDQGLLNLYFSDWAHKDISKHLPFIYNMCSTACYSYLPAFKQFGENVKIIHFIGNSKPWLQYFNSETLQVSCSPGFEHMQLIFEHWWNLFCTHVHSGLQSTMARIDTNTPIASSCTSSSHSFAYYINESKCEDSLCTEQFYDTAVNDIPVWDPWEHYQPVDSSENKSTDSPVNSSENKSTDNPVDSSEYKSTDIPVVENSNIQPNPSSYYVENVQNNFQPTFHESSSCSTHSNQSSNVHVEYFNNVQQESHVNNDNRQKYEHVSIACEPPPNFVHSQMQLPAQNIPAYQSVTSTVLCDVNFASTITVTTEPATHASNTEPRTESNGGLAGAFAQMNLREPRSASQNALEDHLRRQGWESGRIDYLGQDSFDNVWKKICETMAGGPKKEPSPPKEDFEPAVVRAVIRPAVTPEPPVDPTPESASTPLAVAAIPESATAVQSVVADIAAVPEVTPNGASESAPVFVRDAVPVFEPAVVRSVPSTPEAAAPAPDFTTASADASATATVSSPDSAVVADVPELAAEAAVVRTSISESEEAAVVRTSISESDPDTVSPAVIPDSVVVASPAVIPDSVVVASPAVIPDSVVVASPAVIPDSVVVATPAVVPDSVEVASPAVIADSAVPATPVVIPDSVVTSEPAVVPEPAPALEPAVVHVASAPVVAEPPAVTSTAEPAATPAAPGAAPLTEPKLDASKKTKAVDVQKQAESAVVKTEEQKPAEKEKSAPAAEEKKEAVKPAEGQSSEPTPVPPPRKSGKNGGATAKKTTKKK